ncbi:cyclophilin B precursor [Basidiobolus meristosporus CBS 931.73]|uniref:Peptidyl-prolyl cis-trans isomerase n=1 Tax=Basidiobolus meristosporus CBS 931.73 TaxID=1314790 RepID=A0A1Y1YDD7_9FUNG|nr:cyclophilin B precursor [Basidiobolus meristosporus CBS 931.73]|eukprot:ORX96051.1 cyclophilin B precursor [Basidiobolus meristosporus CBS 931.73]
MLPQIKPFIITLLTLSMVTGAPYTHPRVTNKVYLDLTQGGKPLGRVVLGLYGDIVPRTVNNFKALISGVKGTPLHYQGNSFHRVLRDFIIQAGSITPHGGDSIYGGFFKDENFALPHNSPGILSMANAGPDSNTSQFFITLNPTPWLDGSYVVFGRVLDGMHVVKYVSETPVDSMFKPYESVFIQGCGELKMDSSDYY